MRFITNIIYTGSKTRLECKHESENIENLRLKYRCFQDMDQLSVEAKIQIENKIQDIVTDLLVWRLQLRLA